MNPPRRRDAGLTLVELLTAMALSLLLLGVLVTSLLLVLETAVGKSSARGSGAQDADFIPAQLDANAGVQRLSRTFTADVMNVVKASGVQATTGPLRCAPPAPDPALRTPDTRVASFTFSAAGGGLRYVDYRYSVNAAGTDAQLARYECEGATAAAAAADQASATVLGNALSTTTPPALTGVAASGLKTFRLSITNFAGRLYHLDATMRADATATLAPFVEESPDALPSAQPTFTLTARTALTMLDQDRDGFVDAVLATFGTTTPQPGCTTGWSLLNAPSGGVLGTPVVLGSSVRLPIAGWTAAEDTSTGTTTAVFTVTFTPNLLTCQNLMGFAAQAPTDLAAPVVLAVTDAQRTTSGVDGKMETGDSLSVTFSEPLATSSVTTGVDKVKVTVRGGKASAPNAAQDTLDISGNGSAKDITSGALPLGATAAYITAETKAAGHDATVSLDTTGRTIRVVLNGACSGQGCDALAAGTGTFTFVPSADITDRATTPNPAVAKTTGPAPGAGWRLF